MYISSCFNCQIELCEHEVFYSPLLSNQTESQVLYELNIGKENHVLLTIGLRFSIEWKLIYHGFCGCTSILNGVLCVQRI